MGGMPIYIRGNLKFKEDFILTASRDKENLKESEKKVQWIKNKNHKVQGNIEILVLKCSPDKLLTIYDEKDDRRTKLERQRDEQLAERVNYLIKMAAHKSYRERVKEYNVYLSSLSEYHDIQKISGGTRK